MVHTRLESIVPAEASGIGAAAVCALAGAPPVPAMVLGAVVAAAVLIPLRGQSLVDVGAARIRHLAARRGRFGPPEPFPARSAADSGGIGAESRERPGSLGAPPTAGFVWDRGELLCAMQVHSAGSAVTRVSTRRRRRATDAALTPAVLAPLLDQFDIRLSGIDIHARSLRTAGPGPSAQACRRLIGPLPASPRRDLLVVARLDPALCPDAVVRRAGNGNDAGGRGAERAAGVAAARIARTLERQGFTCTMLTAADLDAAPGLFLDPGGGASAAARPGGPPATVRPRWDHAVVADAAHTCFRLPVGPRDADPDPWARVWDSDCDATVVSVAVRRGQGADLVRVGAVARYVSTEPVTAPPVPGARLLTGAQGDGVWATVPRGGTLLATAAGMREVSGNDAEACALAAGGDGQLIGGAPDGKAVLAPLTGPGLATVEIAGSAYVARQAVVRALATGARIAVVTDRPGEWRHLEAEVGDRDALRVDAGGSTASGAVTEPGTGLTAEDLRLFGAVVVDCVDGAPRLPAVPSDSTLVVVVPRPTSADVDARLTQDPLSPGTVHVEVHGCAATARTVTIPDEARLIGRPG